MPRTIPASEVKNRFGAVLCWVRQTQDEVIIESRGEPKAVIIAYEEYAKFQELKEQRRREEILARLDKLRQEVSARNRDLSEEQALALADRVADDTIDEMVTEGKIRFTETDK